MTTTNPETGTRIDEIAPSIYRISTPVPPTAIPGGFTFNQYLVLDDEPLLFHTGPRRMFPLVRQAIEHVMPISMLRWVSFSHVEADECGALSELVAVAPRVSPMVGRIAAMVSVEDMTDRPVKALADGESHTLGTRRVTWIDAPHMPHGWECGYLYEATTRTLLCGDLFTQPGAEHAPLVESDILEPSEAMRRALDYYSHGTQAPAHLERMAAIGPTTLACMHGSAWHGDGGRLMTALAKRLSDERA